MTPFQEQIAADNAAVFINDMEFAELHNLNGIECKAIVQDISVAQSLSIDVGKDDNYYGIYGERLQVNCLKDALPEVPVYGMQFYLDDRLYEVESTGDDMGILTIQLVANSR